jgi:hypothetical protein
VDTNSLICTWLPFSKTREVELKKFITKIAIINKKDASEREFNVFLEYKKGNIVLTFSAAAFEEFRVITKNILLSSGLNINQAQVSVSTLSTS